MLTRNFRTVSASFCLDALPRYSRYSNAPSPNPHASASAAASPAGARIAISSCLKRRPCLAAIAPASRSRSTSPLPTPITITRRPFTMSTPTSPALPDSVPSFSIARAASRCSAGAASAPLSSFPLSSASSTIAPVRGSLPAAVICTSVLVGIMAQRYGGPDHRATGPPPPRQALKGSFPRRRTGGRQRAALFKPTEERGAAALHDEKRFLVFGFFCELERPVVGDQRFVGLVLHHEDVAPGDPGVGVLRIGGDHPVRLGQSFVLLVQQQGTLNPEQPERAGARRISRHHAQVAGFDSQVLATAFGEHDGDVVAARGKALRGLLGGEPEIRLLGGRVGGP